MPPKSVGNRTEPARTRKASKKEKESKSTGDIMDALSKMAPKEKNDEKNGKNGETAGTRVISEHPVIKPSKQNSPEAEVEVESGVEEVDVIKEVNSENAQGQKDTYNHDNQRQGVDAVVKEFYVHSTSNEGLTDDASQPVKATTNEVLAALKELTTSYTKVDDSLNHPMKGIRSQVVK